MEYYSAIKNNKMRSLIEIWIDLESVIESEVVREKTNTKY